MLAINSHYTREDVWRILEPTLEYKLRGNWATGYSVIKNYLVAFVNIQTAGRTGHDFPNSYNPDTGLMKWYGKPNAHSAQPIFKKLFEGNLELLIFARWNSAKPKFIFLGQAQIISFIDNVTVNQSIETIELNLSLYSGNMDSDPGPEGAPLSGYEGGRTTALVNKYERDPSLRLACLDFYGYICQICGFDFEGFYGGIGRNYCHVHHIRPLSEMKKITKINPITDLIPVCPNCHSMLHKTTPALLPEHLKKLIQKINN